jgi:hypothetical protein
MTKERCETCRWVRTFRPRADEQERYGFGEVGYGCRYPGYEGYTKAGHACKSYARKDAQP